jgi:hypothetical protein
MYAVIIDGTVAELLAVAPILTPGESAVIMPCGAEVQPGWRLEAGALIPLMEPDPYVVEPEYLDLGQVSIGHAERLYAAAQIEAESPAGDGPATVLLDLLKL